MRFVFYLMILAAPAAFAETAAVDTTLTDLGDMVVSGQAGEAPSPDKTKIDAPVIRVRDPGSLADLGGLIPSARVSTNSRGDSHLMIRGAPERHVQTFLDDIPLNLPWDERVDLQTIPITGAGRIEGTRGMTTLLDGPGVLAGSARILPPGPVGDGRRTRVGMAFGEFGKTIVDLQHQDRLGSDAAVLEVTGDDPCVPAVLSRPSEDDDPLEVIREALEHHPGRASPGVLHQNDARQAERRDGVTVDLPNGIRVEERDHFACTDWLACPVRAASPRAIAAR